MGDRHCKNINSALLCGAEEKNKGWLCWIWLGIRTVVSCLAVQDSALVELEWGYKTDIPLIKYFFAIFQKMSGWGMETIFLMAGIACMFYAGREHPLRRNRWISALALFFGICMVFGRSYYDLGNWNYIFHGRLQFGLACFVVAGYYWLFKNFFLLLKTAADRWNLGRSTPEGKIGQYIALLLFLLVVVHILIEDRIRWYQWMLLIVCSVVISHTRNNGIYVLVLFCGTLVLAYRKYWKLCIPILLSLFLSCYLVQNIYMVQKGIASGEIGETLSIPLQQTARYAREHYEDITEEEMEILTHLFQKDMNTLAEVYDPEKSDPVKAGFLPHPTSEELASYFRVWCAQLVRHPDTYIQAFLNHIYGYFYPNREEYGNRIGYYSLFQGKQYWDDGVLNYKFMVEDRKVRDMFEQGAYWVERLPLIGMLYSCGFHNYILIACAVFLLAQKRYREMLVLVPSILTMLVCLVSPVDAYIRYMLPVMAAMPVNIAWCHYAAMKVKADEKEEIT